MERVTRSEAARELGLDKATVTRWVQKNPALLDEGGLVDVEALRAHRETVINPKLQTRGPTVPRAAARTAPALTAAGVGAAVPAGPTMNDHRARSEAAKAEVAELDLAERLGRTLRREEVEAAVVHAADILSQKAGQMARDRAEALTRIDDVRAMERALEDMMRELLEAGAEALTKAAEGDRIASAA